MKKILFLLSLLMYISCSDNIVNLEDTTNNGKETEVFINGVKARQKGVTRAFNYKDELGYSMADEGRYSVWYFVRIDGNIPCEGDHQFPSNEYIPRTSSNKTLLSDDNHGYVLSNVYWKSCANFSKYIYSKDGSVLKEIIVEEPTVEELLKSDKGTKGDVNGYLTHQDELHFLWYVCKKQDSDHCWHVDGILTTKDKTNISQTIYGDEIEDLYNKRGMVNDDEHVVNNENIEVDIHQQKHNDWSEVKTSIHLRNISDVTITIPIEKEFASPCDDFAIRSYEMYESVEANQIGNDTSLRVYEDLNVTIEHKENCIVISVKGITQDMLYANNGEVTVEIHNYYSSLLEEELWDKLKKSTVDLSSKFIRLCGQIHSSLNDSDSDKWIMF